MDPHTTHLAMIVVFLIGYLLITLEHVTKVNKSTIALLMAVACWTLEFMSPHHTLSEDLRALSEHTGSLSQVIFFILGALTLVEGISAHQGFSIVSDAIQVGSKKRLLWTVGLITFFLSAVLDNLTTTIVMVSLMSKLIDKGEDRLIIGGAIVIAANAGGAWTPIGDVTTTMLWIGGQLSTFSVIKQLFIPSLACLVGALAVLSLSLKGVFTPLKNSEIEIKKEPLSRPIFFLGLGALIFVPIFKGLTGLPPFMGMLLGLGVFWLVTDLYHTGKEDRDHLRVPHILTKIDMSGLLFFLGILLAVDALETAGILRQFAYRVDAVFESYAPIAIFLGFLSAVIDNVPLVAASMSMYELTHYPTDHAFWELMAYCAGTGGSLLIIGSVAGVVFMGLEKVSFFWYLKRISLAALVGYLLGVAVYLA